MKEREGGKRGREKRREGRKGKGEEERKGGRKIDNMCLRCVYMTVYKSLE